MTMKRNVQSPRVIRSKCVLSNRLRVSGERVRSQSRNVEPENEFWASAAPTKDVRSSVQFANVQSLRYMLANEQSTKRVLANVEARISQSVKSQSSKEQF